MALAPGSAISPALLKGLEAQAPGEGILPSSFLGSFHLLFGRRLCPFIYSGTPVGLGDKAFFCDHLMTDETSRMDLPLCTLYTRPFRQGGTLVGHRKHEPSFDALGPPVKARTVHGIASTLFLCRLGLGDVNRTRSSDRRSEGCTIYVIG